MTVARSRAWGRGVAMAVFALSSIVLGVTEAPACPPTGPVCVASAGQSNGIGRAVSAAVPAQDVNVREIVEGVQCTLRAPEGSCASSTSPPADPAPVASPNTSPVASTPPVPEPKPAAASPVANPVASQPRARAERTASSSEAPAKRPAPSKESRPSVHIIRLPVFLEHETVAVALSILVGLGAAAGLYSLLTLGTRRRRRRKTASTIAEEGGAAYRKLTTTLVATLSHELFTPLTPVKGYAALLKRHDLPAERIHEVAEEVAGASERLERVLGTLVHFAEVEGGVAQQRRDIVDLESLARTAAERMGLYGAGRITVAVEPGLGRIHANEPLLSLALESLLDNAVKFSPNGGPIRIHVGTIGGELERTLQITVADRGIGMSKEQLRTAFEPFRQVDGSTTRRFGGLGIGVPFADRVARVHGGRLTATSRPRRGSAFTISIPLVPAGQPVNAAMPALV